MNDDKKVPMPPTKTELYLSVAFWAELLGILDKKVQSLSDGEGYGQIGVSIYMQDRKITHVKFVDEISGKRLKEMADKSMLSPQSDKS